MLKAIKLVYRNMVIGRPKFGLYGLLLLAGLCTVNLYIHALKFGPRTAAVMAFLALVAWLVMLPMILTLIDLKMNPQRLEKIWSTMHGDSV